MSAVIKQYLLNALLYTTTSKFNTIRINHCYITVNKCSHFHISLLGSPTRWLPCMTKITSTT